MLHYVVQRVAYVLNSEGKPLSRAKALCLALAYKADLGDTTESTSLEIL